MVRRHIYTPLSSPSFCFVLNEQNVYRYSVDETIDWVRTQVVESKETSFEILAIVYGKKLKNMVSYFSNVNAKESFANIF